MELRHLRYFATLAQELHFGRAAEKLHISQPPLSTQIQDLENELGVSLFERNRRQVKLTEPGKVFLKSTRTILTDIHKAVEEVQAADRGDLDTLSVGYRSAVMLNIISPILKQFQTNYPNVRLKFAQGSLTELYDAVNEHRLDIGFIDAPVSQHDADKSNNNINGLPVLQLRLAIAVPAGHPLAKRKSVSLNEFAADDFIFMNPQAVPSVHDLWIGLCQQAGFSPKVKNRCDQLSEVLTYVAAGYGITFAPDNIQGMWSDMITYLELEDPAYVSIFMIHSNDNESKSMQAFRRVSQEFAKQQTFN
jgi:DNA-binding transcriptional LysR family regulator